MVMSPSKFSCWHLVANVMSLGGRVLGQAVVRHAFNPNTGESVGSRLISVSSKPFWSMKRVSGQPGLFVTQRDHVSKNQKGGKNKNRKRDRIFKS